MTEGDGADVLAIDGPAGAGKSTVARGAAARLGIAMLDTGAMYRAATLACLRAAIDLDDSEACSKLVRALKIDQDGACTKLDGRDVSLAIRTPEVTGAVSRVAAHPTVRAIMVEHQRRWATARGGAVVEGRDIGTVVFPHARLKVFLVASDTERAKRRRLDEVAAGRIAALDEVVAAIRERDTLDSQRDASPLRAAPDALLIDTTGRSIDDVVDEIVRSFERR